MNWTKVTAATMLLMTIIFPVGAQGRFVPKVWAGIDGGAGLLLINGKTAVRFKVPNGSLSPSRRAEVAADRLRGMVQAGLSPYTVAATGNHRSGKVSASGNMIVRVTKADARAASSDVVALAKFWSGNIRRLLLMPPVMLSTQNLLVPMGEVRTVEVSGAATGPLTAAVADNMIAFPTVDSDGRQVLIQGLTPGKTVVDVDVDGFVISLSVDVRRYAGAMASGLESVVTGEPCPSATMQDAAFRSAMRGARLEPGASVEVLGVENVREPLEAGTSRIVSVRVKMDGPDYIPFTASVPVIVRNAYLGYPKPNDLFYSNSPERLLKFQTLFVGRTQADRSARLLYHHQNMTGQRARFTVEMVNNTDTDASFRVFGGHAAVDSDTVVVGYLAGKSFLQGYSDNVSMVENVTAKSRLVLVSEMLGRGETVSGILEVAQIRGSEAYMVVSIMPPQEGDQIAGSIGPAPEKIAWRLSNEVYPTPSKILNENYQIGDKWKFISVGKFAIDSFDTSHKLSGNYGVSYYINVTVNNPLTESKKFSVGFDPTAGSASVVAMINGRFVGGKYLKPPDEFELASYILEPGEERLLRIIFLPLAGSNYPAKIVVRS